ncbi:MAG: hypothetical protein IPO18_06270 [bacterium]|nr:hypothetical protein [bacterium]
MAIGADDLRRRKCRHGTGHRLITGEWPMLKGCLDPKVTTGSPGRGGRGGHADGGAGALLRHLRMIYDGNHRKPNPLMRLMLGLMVKKAVVSDKPYRHNSPTGGGFLVRDTRDFAAERDRLITYLQRTQQLGGNHFDGLESPSSGPLTRQWSNLFYKHLDHHLGQFGV